MLLPFNQKGKASLGNFNRWAATDVIHSFTLSKQSHIIIIYQYSGGAGSSHVVMRLNIDSVPQKHSMSITGNTALVGNFKL